VINNPVVSWASADTTIAIVDQSGTVTAVAVGSVTIVATSGGETGSAGVTVGEGFVAGDSLAIIDSTRIVLLSDSAERATGTYRFQRTSGPMPDWDTVAVVVGAQGPGFLRRVERVSVAGDLATIETSDADLTEAVKVGAFATSSRVFDDSAANVQGNIQWGPTQVLSLAEGVQTSAAGGISLNGVKLAFKVPGKTAEVEASFTINDGTISFPVIMDLGTRIELGSGIIPLPELKEFHAIFGGGVELDINQYTIAVTGALTASKDSTIQRPLAKFSKRFAVFAGSVPVTGELILSFKAEAAIQASVAVELTGDFQAGFGVQAGARWNKGSGWSDASGANQNFDSSPLGFGVKGSVEAKVAVVPELFLRLYDVAGPFINIQPYLKASADMTVPAYDWRAGIDHGIDLVGGFKVQILSKTLASFSLGVPLYVIPLLEAYSDGPLRVRETTSGSDLPPSYRIRVRPGFTVVDALLGRNHSESFRDTTFARGSPILLDDIRSGQGFPHVTQLMRIQGNCTPGADRITKGIVSDFSHGILGIGGDKDTTEVVFFPHCIPFGAIQPSVVTSGPDQDPDGYQIRFERIDTTGSSPKWFTDTADVAPSPNLAPFIPIGVSGQTLLDSLIPLNPKPPGNNATGAFQLSLHDVRKNCAVARPAVHPITSYSGDTVQTSFQVHCIHLGAVMARSTLQDSDPVPGFPVVHSATVTETGAGAVVASDTLVASDSTVAGQLIPLFTASGADGRHAAVLTPQANRCTPQGGGSRAVTVLSADTTVADYLVTCVERFHLRNTTFGSGTPDPDGYQVVIDGGQTIDVATNGTVPVAGLPPGGHTLQYTGLASHCGLRVAPPTATVPVADSTLLEFQVECGTFAAPSGLSAGATGPNAIRLDWIGGNDPVHSVVLHRVYRDGAVFDSVPAPLVTWSDTTLTPNESHDYTVTAVNGQGTESAPSSTVRATSLALPPTGLVATASGAADISLTWDFVTGIQGYRVYRDGAVLPGIVTDSAFVDTGLGSATRFDYRVTALNDASVESAASAPDSAVTDPLPPSGLSAQTSLTVVSLNWSAGGPEVVMYLVQRDGAVLDSTPSTSYSDTLVSSNTSYQYTVEARTSVGVLSGPSALVTATTLPDAPSGLTATAVSDTRIDLSWTRPSGQVGQYRVTRTGLDTLVAGTAFGDTGLTPSTTYDYQVSAFGVTGLEGPAAAASATTMPATTGGLLVITQTSELASASYTVAIEGAGGFRQTSAIGANDQVLFSQLAPGTYGVALQGTPAACTVAGLNPRVESVQVGVVTQTVFVVSCSGTDAP
jgi:fibronectin type 3 domain-containing protein